MYIIVYSIDECATSMCSGLNYSVLDNNSLHYSEVHLWSEPNWVSVYSHGDSFRSLVHPTS